MGRAKRLRPLSLLRAELMAPGFSRYAFAGGCDRAGVRAQFHRMERRTIEVWDLHEGLGGVALVAIP